jgi:hypothetical protein
MRFGYQTLLCVFALSAAGCGDSPPSNSTGEVDAQLIEDTAGQDVTTNDVEDGADDTGIAIPDIEDVRVDTADTGNSSSGEPCFDDNDCAEGECYQVFVDSEEGVCAESCATDTDCPRDTNCVLLLNTGNDAERICLPQDLCLDQDGDEFGVGPGCLGRDCDDTSEFRNAGTPEVCDGLDNNCDEIIDNNPTDAQRPCDTGLLGECSDGTTVCELGVIECQQISVPSDERCDERDNDCDGLTDEGADGLALTRTCYDGPAGTLGVGSCGGGAQTCESGGYTGCSGQTLPQTEACDTEDNDCDGQVDEGLELFTWYRDSDNDTYGSDTEPIVEACRRPAGYVAQRGDCNDSDDRIRPGATDAPADGIDANCDGTELCYADLDDDGYRTGNGTVIFSSDTTCDGDGEASTTTPTGDCDDSLSSVYPSAPELCDGEDNDCSGRIDEGAGCYSNGEACEDAADCNSGICSANICMAPLTCQDLGTCPPLASIISGGDVSSPSYRMRIAVGDPVVAQPRTSARFTLQIGPAAGLTRQVTP